MYKNQDWEVERFQANIMFLSLTPSKSKWLKAPWRAPVPPPTTTGPPSSCSCRLICRAGSGWSYVSVWVYLSQYLYARIPAHTAVKSFICAHYIIKRYIINFIKPLALGKFIAAFWGSGLEWTQSAPTQAVICGDSFMGLLSCSVWVWGNVKRFSGERLGRPSLSGQKNPRLNTNAFAGVEQSSLAAERRCDSCVLLPQGTMPSPTWNSLLYLWLCMWGTGPFNSLLPPCERKWGFFF